MIAAATEKQLLHLRSQSERQVAEKAEAATRLQHMQQQLQMSQRQLEEAQAAVEVKSAALSALQGTLVDVEAAACQSSEPPFHLVHEMRRDFVDTEPTAADPVAGVPLSSVHRLALPTTACHRFQKLLLAKLEQSPGSADC